MAEPAGTTEHTGRALPSGLEGEDIAVLAGKITAGADREPIGVDAPFTLTKVGSVPACTEADVERATRRARAAQTGWAERSFAERASVVREFHDLVLSEQERILDLLQLEAGKARKDAFDEVLEMTSTAQYYASEGDRFVQTRRCDSSIPFVTATYEHRDPVGVVGVVAPFNYPLTLSVSDAIPALLAGNAVVIKPDERTPYAVAFAKRLLERAGLPAECFQVVTGGATVGEALIDRVDYLQFTGSTATGRVVARRAAGNLIDYSLELGGKNPMVVLEDAPVKKSVRGAVRGSFSNAGQLCLSFERIYVHESIYGEFLDRFVEATEDLVVGPALSFEADVGSLVSADHLEAVHDHVEDARENGATVETGGRALPSLGPCFYAPTVLTGVDSGAACYREETFGPVVAVSPVESASEAVARANDSEYGLNAGVYSGDRDRGRAVAERIDCGTVTINESAFAGYATLDAPMAGRNDSGVGGRHGPDGIRKYTEPKTVASHRGPVTAHPRTELEGPYRYLASTALRASDRLRTARAALRRWFGSR